MPDIRRLYELQELDLELSGAEESLAQVRARLSDDSEIVNTRERQQELETQLDALTASRRAAERTLSQLKDTLQRVDSRLYGGAVTNARELSAAEEERGFILTQQREEEDKLLELMVEIEEVEPAVDEARERLEKLEADRPGQEADLRAKEEQLSSQIADLGQSREEIASLQPAGTLSLYESLRKSRGGRAVAKVERGMCQGCRLTLSSMELQRARSAQELVQCGSCRRILHLL